MKVRLIMKEQQWFTYEKEVDIPKSLYNKFLKNKLSDDEIRELVWEAENGVEGSHDETQQWLEDIEIVKTKK